MGLSFTTEQQNVVKNRGVLLVGASAGSGKTAVLIENIVERLKHLENVLEMVIITFTKAAGQELKEKLVKRLYQAASDKRECLDAATQMKTDIQTIKAHLIGQIRAIPHAIIGTIDGFCLTVYRQHFEDISQEPLLVALDQEEQAAMFSNACKAELEERLAAGDEDVFLLAEQFGKGGNVRELEEELYKLHQFLCVQADEEAFLRFAQEEAQLPLVAKDGGATKRAAQFVLQDLKKQAAAILAHYADKVRMGDQALLMETGKGLSSVKRAMSKAVKAIEMLEDMLTQSDLLGMITTVLAQPSFSTSTANLQTTNPTLEVGWDAAKKLLARMEKQKKEWNNLLLLGNLDDKDPNTHLEQLEAAEASAAKTLMRLVALLNGTRTRYARAKQEEGKLDFADMERFALSILQNPARQAEWQARIKVVYIDEYQDTNYLQEAILQQITKDAFFMVGDVKQSIYGFRFAEPSIFLNKIADIASNQSTAGYEKLNHNFRSNLGVIGFVNAVMGGVMTKAFGGIAYQSEAELVHKEGFLVPIEEGTRPVTVAVFAKEESQTEPLPPVYSPNEGTVKQAHIGNEARYVANEILSLVGKRKLYKVQNDEVVLDRLVRYQDIVILAQKRKHADEVVLALQKSGIPYRGDGFGGAGDFHDISLLVQYLKLLDNVMQDIPLYAVMSSYLGGFCDRELQSIRKAGGNTYFWEDVFSYTQDDALRKKVTAFLDRLNHHQQQASLEPVDELLQRVLTETGFDGYLLLQEDSNRIENVNAFLFSLQGKDWASTLPQFLEVYESMKKEEIKKASGGEDSVLLQTVHSSKGLEYPIVFFVGLEHECRPNQQYEPKVAASPTLGLFPQAFEAEGQKKQDTVSKRAERLERKQKQLLEHARLFYVGMTRAKQHLYLTATTSKAFEKSESPDQHKSFLDWVNYAKTGASDCPIQAAVLDTATLPLDERGEQERLPLVLDDKAAPLPVDVGYPHEAATKTARKYTVSALNQEFADTTHTAPLVATEEPFLVDDPFSESEELPKQAKTGAQSAKTGSAYHAFLQFANFGKHTQPEVVAQIAALKERGVVEQTAYLDAARLSEILSDPLFLPLRTGEGLRECPFMLYVPANLVKDTTCTDRVLVQGVIDLVIPTQNPDEVVLVDYKVTGKTPQEVQKTYQKQIDIYRLALQKAFGKKVVRAVVYVINQKKAIDL